ncbi:ATP-binding protein [Lacinutrix sp. MedPE-SW]|uniref:ATP-binding protein n=1 Tax=Lacinutrix sp. MedPE-SW TaxID=1860087 RepID=UPI00091CF16A|nr:ATP-binding protein [Lacinutrix sp. MedPE-SW]OIQ20255.1 MAG: nicotinate-nucleotide adenylyltransferase [Lacinutrix sp. MedPE-SW]
MEKKLKQADSNCLKIALFGPESTGKTTLAIQLATHYKTKWVPEFAREYLQKKWDDTAKICELKDILPIGIGQMELENTLAKKANKLLICDTNLLETKVYSETYYSGKCPPEIAKYALENKYDLYFLTYIDTPWEADDLRDRPDDRLLMFNAFKSTLVSNNIPYVLLKGTKEERLTKAITCIDKLIDSRT